MDKDNIPTNESAPTVPELQETLENDESTKSTEPVAAEETAKVEEPAETPEKPAEKPAEEPAKEEAPEEKPEKITIEPSVAAEPAGGNRVMLIAVIVIAFLLVLGVGIVTIIMMNNKKTSSFDDLSNEVASIIEDTKNEIEQQKKEAEEKKAKEAEEKKKKEEEEKLKKEQEAKEKAEAEKKAKEEAEKKKTTTSLKIDDLADEIKKALNEYVEFEAYGVSKDVKRTIYQPTGFKTAIMLKGNQIVSNGTFSASSEQQAAIEKKITDVLDSYGFESASKYTFDLGLSSETFYNSRNNIVCSVEKRDKAILDYAPASCALITSYDLEDKSLVNSLAEAYKKGRNQYPVYIAGAKSEASDKKLADSIENSDYKEYQTIMVSTGENAAIVFYRESPSKEWIYLTATQAFIDCSKYSGELKKALGNLCTE